MFNKIVIVCLVVLSICSSAFAATWLGSVSRAWNDGANWDIGIPPTQDEMALIGSMPGPVVDSGTTAVASAVRIGISAGEDGAVEVNGGTLTSKSGSRIDIGYDVGKSGTLTINSGTVTSGSSVYVGKNGPGTLNMNGGTLNATVSGTALTIAQPVSSVGQVYLYGGTINCADLSMAPNGGTAAMDITYGVLIINGDKTPTIDIYVNTNHWITAFGGTGTVVFDYDITNAGKTTVMAANPQKAQNPVPANNAVLGIVTDVNLSWTAGLGAESHDVYFGTISPGIYRGNQTATTFDPGQLPYDTTYYWRIDEVNEANAVTTGDVWKFTIDSGLAKNPDPVSGSRSVPVYQVLRWAGGSSPDAYDVYFGTDVTGVTNAARLAGDLDGKGKVDYDDLFILADYWLQNPDGSVPYAGVNDDNTVDFRDYAQLAGHWMTGPNPLFKGSTTAASYDPCGLTLNTTYYWRVDEVYGPLIRKGNVWHFTTAIIDSNYTLIGKVMCGYQGWFNCPSDGTNRGWAHWSTSGSSFTSSTCRVAMWPDMNDMTTAEKFEATGFYDGVTHYYVFSSHNLALVKRHFMWMRDYGIDGVYLQRFAKEVIKQTDSSFSNRNEVLDYCKNAANMYGRKYAVMYDLSNIKLADIPKVENDWKYLVDTKMVTRDPTDLAYMYHKGRPVVAVWGMGFGRGYEPGCPALIDFLRNDPVYGGNIVMIGVNDNWRTNNDLSLQQCLALADIISPWMVGRFDSSGVDNWCVSGWIPDLNWCTAHNKEYLLVLWPGYSYHNADHSKPLNEIPRWGGNFIWQQFYRSVGANITMLYIAMFDEVDEATAIFKVSNNPPVSPPFITYREDLPGEGKFCVPNGAELPADHYLWLVGQGGRMLRGEIPLSQNKPTR
jgi:hypothetical protein